MSNKFGYVEQTSAMEKIKTIIYSDMHFNQHEQNFQEFQDKFRRTNLRIHQVEEAEIRTKGICNLLSEMMAEIFLKLGKEMDI